MHLLSQAVHYTRCPKMSTLYVLNNFCQQLIRCNDLWYEKIWHQKLTSCYTAQPAQSTNYSKENNMPPVRRTSSAFHKVVRRHFQKWRTSSQWRLSRQFDNAYSRNNVSALLLKITFWDFPKLSGYSWQVRWANVKTFDVKFSQDLTYRKSESKIVF